MNFLVVGASMSGTDVACLLLTIVTILQTYNIWIVFKRLDHHSKWITSHEEWLKVHSGQLLTLAGIIDRKVKDDAKYFN